MGRRTLHYILVAAMSVFSITALSHSAMFDDYFAFDNANEGETAAGCGRQATAVGGAKGVAVASPAATRSDLHPPHCPRRRVPTNPGSPRAP